MTKVPGRQSLPALDNSRSVKNPDLLNIADKNYASTIMRYSNLALLFSQLETKDKHIVGAINEVKSLNDTKLNKTDANKLNCVTIDNVSLKEYILTKLTETEKVHYLIAKTTCTDLPKASNFFVTVETPGLYTYKVTAKELNDSNGIYVCTYRTISSSWTKWEKVCTTTVADVGVTTISMSSTYTDGADCKYQVINGICYVNFLSGAYKLTSDVAGVVLATGLPIPKSGSVSVTYIPWGFSDSSCRQVILFVEGDGKMILHAYSNANSGSMFYSFSYPVAES